MKKRFLALFTLCSFLQTPLLVAEEVGLYVGAGYASTNIDLTIDSLSEEANKLLDQGTDSLMFIAGYDINQYLGIEGRYYLNNSSIAFDYYIGELPLEYKAETMTLYAKPQLDLGAITLYGLAGVAFNNYSINDVLNLGGDTSDALFSWGAGAKFKVTQSLGLFVDYTDLGTSDNILIDTTLNSWNFGATYKF